MQSVAVDKAGSRIDDEGVRAHSETEVVLDIDTSAGRRMLKLGQGFRVAETPSLRAELGRILGPRALAPAPEPAAVAS